MPAVQRKQASADPLAVWRQDTATDGSDAPSSSFTGVQLHNANGRVGVGSLSLCNDKFVWTQASSGALSDLTNTPTKGSKGKAKAAKTRYSVPLASVSTAQADTTKTCLRVQLRTGEGLTTIGLVFPSGQAAGKGNAVKALNFLLGSSTSTKQQPKAAVKGKGNARAADRIRMLKARQAAKAKARLAAAQEKVVASSQEQAAAAASQEPEPLKADLTVEVTSSGSDTDSQTMSRSPVVTPSEAVTPIRMPTPPCDDEWLREAARVAMDPDASEEVKDGMHARIYGRCGYKIGRYPSILPQDGDKTQRMQALAYAMNAELTIMDTLRKAEKDRVTTLTGARSRRCRGGLQYTDVRTGAAISCAEYERRYFATIVAEWEHALALWQEQQSEQQFDDDEAEVAALNREVMSPASQPESPPPRDWQQEQVEQQQQGDVQDSQSAEVEQQSAARSPATPPSSPQPASAAAASPLQALFTPVKAKCTLRRDRAPSADSEPEAPVTPKASVPSPSRIPVLRRSPFKSQTSIGSPAPGAVGSPQPQSRLPTPGRRRSPAVKAQHTRRSPAVKRSPAPRTPVMRRRRASANSQGARSAGTGGVSSARRKVSTKPLRRRKAPHSAPPTKPLRRRPGSAQKSTGKKRRSKATPQRVSVASPQVEPQTQRAAAMTASPQQQQRLSALAHEASQEWSIGSPIAASGVVPRRLLTAAPPSSPPQDNAAAAVIEAEAMAAVEAVEVAEAEAEAGAVVEVPTSPKEEAEMQVSVEQEEDGGDKESMLSDSKIEVEEAAVTVAEVTAAVEIEAKVEVDMDSEVEAKATSEVEEEEADIEQSEPQIFGSDAAEAKAEMHVDTEAEAAGAAEAQDPVVVEAEVVEVAALGQHLAAVVEGCDAVAESALPSHTAEVSPRAPHPQPALSASAAVGSPHAAQPPKPATVAVASPTPAVVVPAPPALPEMASPGSVSTPTAAPHHSSPRATPRRPESGSRVLRMLAQHMRFLSHEECLLIDAVLAGTVATLNAQPAAAGGLHRPQLAALRDAVATATQGALIAAAEAAAVQSPAAEGGTVGLLTVPTRAGTLPSPCKRSRSVAKMMSPGQAVPAAPATSEPAQQQQHQQPEAIGFSGRDPIVRVRTLLPVAPRSPRTATRRGRGASSPRTFTHRVSPSPATPDQLSRAAASGRWSPALHRSASASVLQGKGGVGVGVVKAVAKVLPAVRSEGQGASVWRSAKIIVARNSGHTLQLRSSSRAGAASAPPTATLPQVAEAEGEAEDVAEQVEVSAAAPAPASPTEQRKMGHMLPSPVKDAPEQDGSIHTPQPKRRRASPAASASPGSSISGRSPLRTSGTAFSPVARKL